MEMRLTVDETKNTGLVTEPIEEQQRAEAGLSGASADADAPVANEEANTASPQETGNDGFVIHILRLYNSFQFIVLLCLIHPFEVNREKIIVATPVKFLSVKF